MQRQILHLPPQRAQLPDPAHVAVRGLQGSPQRPWARVRRNAHDTWLGTDPRVCQQLAGGAKRVGDAWEEAVGVRDVVGSDEELKGGRAGGCQVVGIAVMGVKPTAGWGEGDFAGGGVRGQGARRVGLGAELG